MERQTIWFVGDLHGELRRFRAAVEQAQAKRVICEGKLDSQRLGRWQRH